MARERFEQSYAPVKERVKQAGQTLTDLAHVGIAYMKIFLNQATEGVAFPNLGKKPPSSINYDLEKRVWSYTDDTWLLNRLARPNVPPAPTSEKPVQVPKKSRE